MSRTFFQSLACLFLFVGAAVQLSGCAGKKVNENDPKEMYEDAEVDVNADRYLVALDKLRIVKSKFSYSKYGALAQLKIGDVYFLQESFPEAAAAYETFVELYPKHEQTAYALFRSGESYFRDIPGTISRDLRSAESAVNALTQYLNRYPSGEFIARAKEMKTASYNKLAEKELEIARFYLKRKKPLAARQRLEKILSFYAESDVAQTAQDLLNHLPSE
ncbi:MAG: outer membrane protein assembly factor BamD [Proteobacteria bacterium]|nr:outer membrane protein assembly factor BamD [Pseudomonadota bacterium]